MRLFSQEKKDVKGLRGLMYNPHLGRGTNEAKNVFLSHNLKYGFECAGSLQVMWCFRALLYLIYELLSAIVWPAWLGWHGSQLCVISVVFCWLRKEWSRKGFSQTWPRVWVQVCRRSPGHVVFHSSSFFFCHPPLPDMSHPPFKCFS